MSALAILFFLFLVTFTNIDKNISVFLFKRSFSGRSVKNCWTLLYFIFPLRKQLFPLLDSLTRDIPLSFSGGDEEN